MYVCICNALNDRQVRATLNRGARTVSALYAENGCRPQCGKCVPLMRQMLDDHRRVCGAEHGPVPLPAMAASPA